MGMFGYNLIGWIVVISSVQVPLKPISPKPAVWCIDRPRRARELLPLSIGTRWLLLLVLISLVRPRSSVPGLSMIPFGGMWVVVVRFDLWGSR